MSAQLTIDLWNRSATNSTQTLRTAGPEEDIWQISFG